MVTRKEKHKKMIIVMCVVRVKLLEIRKVILNQIKVELEGTRVFTKPQKKDF